MGLQAAPVPTMTPPQQRARGPEAGQRAPTAARALEARPVATVNGRLPFEDRRAWKTIQSQPQHPGQICTCIWTVSVEPGAGNPPATELWIRAATARASWPSMAGSVLTPNNTASDTNVRHRGFPGGSAVKNLPAMQETWETQVRSVDWEDPMVKGMATHSSVLAWRIPRTEAPGELQSVGLQRVGHNWSDVACRYTRGIQMLSVIVGHHSRRFQCSACELEGNRAERASEMTNGFSACQHRFYWHLEWTKPSRDQVAFQDFSIRGPQPLAPPYTATVWNAAPQHSRGPRKDIAKPGPEPLTWSITEGREGGHLPRPPKKLDVS